MSHSVVYSDPSGMTWTVARVACLRSFDADGHGSVRAPVRHFVVSPLLKELASGAELRVELDEERSALRIEPA